MAISPEQLCISTPGRICLFGEHQDYLDLPVVAAGISLRVRISGRPRIDSTIRVLLPDSGSEVTFQLDDVIRYELERDYFRSGVKVLREAGIPLTRGCDCIVKGEIPISAGTSSSSAMVVSWIHFLLQMFHGELSVSPQQIARYAHTAEVVSFREPGGMMDQCSTALGGVLAISFYPSLELEKLPVSLKSLVLGDSLQPKDTKRILASVKEKVIRLCAGLKARYPAFSLHTIAADELEPSYADMPDEDFRLLAGTIRNRDITAEAITLLRKPSLDEVLFGRLLNEHQSILRDVLGISTSKIDRMIDAALEAGACGAKINGSGGGGCMFAYASGDPEPIADAIRREGGTPYIIHVDQGTQVDTCY